MFPGILVALIPVLVGQAEKLFDGDDRGKEKRDWVQSMIKEAHPLLQKIEPSWLKPADDALELAVDTAIEFALDKLEE